MYLIRLLWNTCYMAAFKLFDFVCGVSTGAIIAAFLAFDKRSVKEVEEIYDRLGTEA